MALMVLPLELSTEIGYIFIVLAGFGCFIAVDPVTHLCEKCQQESMFKYISYIYLYIYIERERDIYKIIYYHSTYIYISRIIAAMKNGTKIYNFKHIRQ